MSLLSAVVGEKRFLKVLPSADQALSVRGKLYIASDFRHNTGDIGKLDLKDVVLLPWGSSRNICIPLRILVNQQLDITSFCLSSIGKYCGLPMAFRVLVTSSRGSTCKYGRYLAGNAARNTARSAGLKYISCLVSWHPQTCGGSLFL